jgi:hypothetical protein
VTFDNDAAGGVDHPWVDVETDDMPAGSDALAEQGENAQRPAGDVEGAGAGFQRDLVEELLGKGRELVALLEEPVMLTPACP